MTLLRAATGTSTMARPSANAPAAFTRSRTVTRIHATMTTTKTSAFSRVRLRPPSARPSDNHGRAGADPCVRPVIRAINHSARHTKNTSRTDFCNSPSKKIAGAYSASIRPATMPARAEKKRHAADASSTQEHDPMTAWQTRTATRFGPSVE